MYLNHISEKEYTDASCIHNYIVVKLHMHTSINKNSAQPLIHVKVHNLSSLSVPAKSNIFGTGDDKNFSDRPSYLKHHWCQCASYGQFDRKKSLVL